MQDNDDSGVLKVGVGATPLACHTTEHAAILEPVGGILADATTEGYTIEQVEQMVSTLAQYDRPAELAALRELLAKRRK